MYVRLAPSSFTATVKVARHPEPMRRHMTMGIGHLRMRRARHISSLPTAEASSVQILSTSPSSFDVMVFRLTTLLACAALAAAARHPPPAHHGAYAHNYCDPKAAPTCAADASATYCLEDAEYPAYEIKAAIAADHLFAKKYADIGTQSADDLVEALTKKQEEAFDYSFYTGASTGKSPYDVSHWAGPAGYICPSDVKYAMPRRAQNVAGEWRVIVNDVHYYTQTARMETCLFPDASCRTLAPCYKSKCTQKYIYHRMLSFDPCDPYKGLFIDIYRLPSACSCHVAAH